MKIRSLIKQAKWKSHHASGHGAVYKDEDTGPYELVGRLSMTQEQADALTVEGLPPERVTFAVLTEMDRAVICQALQQSQSSLLVSFIRIRLKKDGHGDIGLVELRDYLRALEDAFSG